MAKTANIISKALRDAGIYVSEGKSPPAEYYNPSFELLHDIVNELNMQTAIIFEQKADSVFVSGSTLVFKPYTEDELAIIQGGGTVDITDRLVDFMPLTKPTVYVDDFHLEYMSFRDLLDRTTGSSIECYTFNVCSDRSELVFNANVNGNIKILRKVPIVIDVEPYGEVHVPDSYVHYIVSKLAEAISIRYQDDEKAAIFRGKSAVLGNMLVNSNETKKPIRHNLVEGLNKFRRYGY